MKRYPILLLFLSFILLFACKGNKTEETSETTDSLDSIDTVQVDTIDSTLVSVPEPPPAADKFFDDFVFSFVRNRKFQLSRVVFPLKWEENGETTEKSKEEWKFDRLYSKRDVYMMMFDAPSTLKAPKDTATKEVIVEQINLKTGSVKSYLFEKRRGAWLLVSVSIHPVAQDANANFLAFYQKFATDRSFQQSHVANPFSLTMFDPDSYQPLKGDAFAVQWQDYAPELPSGEFFNVNYGQKYNNNAQRVLTLTSIDGSMSSTITFKNIKGNWTATKLENN